MMKRIVVGLDGSRFSRTATANACGLAKISDGTVVGIGVVDLPGIESIERGAPPGSLWFAEKAEEHKLRDALKKVAQFLSEFEKTCKKLEVRFELHSTQGEPFEAIVEEGKASDLIVIGLRTFYHFETSSRSGDTLKRVLQNSVCPVMAVPESMNRIENVFIAYDGSTESAKALRAFVNRFHPSFQDLDLTLLTVAESKEEGERVSQNAVSYLRCWEKEPTIVVERGRTDEILLQRAKGVKNPLVVMGSFGRNPISEFFFGSTARRIVEDCTIPIMIYH